MSRPVTGRDAVSPLSTPDRRVELDEAAFGLGQQRQGFVELPLLESVPQVATEVVSVALPADPPAGALLVLEGCLRQQYKNYMTKKFS